MAFKLRHMYTHWTKSQEHIIWYWICIAKLPANLSVSLLHIERVLATWRWIALMTLSITTVFACFLYESRYVCSTSKMYAVAKNTQFTTLHCRKTISGFMRSSCFFSVCLFAYNIHQSQKDTKLRACWRYIHQCPRVHFPNSWYI